MTLPNKLGYQVKETYNSSPFEVASQPTIAVEPLTQEVQPIKYDSYYKFVSNEEFQVRKNHIMGHRLLPLVISFLTNCKKEYFTSLFDVNIQTTSDFSLDEFLVAQDIIFSNEESDSKMKEFQSKVEQYKKNYNKELDRLDGVCYDFCSKMFHLLQEQSNIRPLDDQETKTKLLVIRQKFDYIKNCLKQNICNAVIELEKRYNHPKKKRKTLSKKATDHLNHWFFDHLNDPYPSEEEKTILASATGLRIAQINYWFGNKRIRYKRKCLLEEAKKDAQF